MDGDAKNSIYNTKKEMVIKALCEQDAILVTMAKKLEMSLELHNAPNYNKETDKTCPPKCGVVSDLEHIAERIGKNTKIMSEIVDNSIF